MPGDLYLAQRNADPQLLTCREIKDGYVCPTENFVYPFDIEDCRKVVQL